MLGLAKVAEAAGHAETAGAEAVLGLLAAGGGDVAKVVELLLLLDLLVLLLLLLKTAAVVAVGKAAESAAAAVGFGERVRVVKRPVAEVPVRRVDRRWRVVHHADAASAAEGEVEQGRLLVVAAVAVAATAVATAVGVVVLHVLALQLRLDPLAVRGVADHRQNRPDALDEEHALAGLGIVERRLNNIVGERVAQELLEPVPVEELGDERLARLGLGDADALLDDVGRELLHGQGADVAKELARDGVAETVVVEVEDVLLQGGEGCSVSRAN